MKTKQDLAANSASSFLVAFGCAPFLLFLVGIGLSILFSFIFGSTAGIIIGFGLAALIYLLLLMNGFINGARSIFAKTQSISCPYCETENKLLKDVKTFDCKECKQKVLIKDNAGQKIN